MFTTTRSPGKTYSGAEAILQGLAPDGGLFVPLEIPRLKLSIDSWSRLSYDDLAAKIISLYFEQFDNSLLRERVHLAYSAKFGDEKRVAFKILQDATVLELFHGPTLAFKDMALTLLPPLMQMAAEQIGYAGKLMILVATSGDTGSAALHGFADVARVAVNVFYPRGGVSRLQEHQMQAVIARNAKAYQIDGNFDEAQTAVKTLFGNAAFREQLAQHDFMMSSANSINIGRLVPQIAYYYYSYAALMRRGAIKSGEPVNFVVPTGNFGNILAGYYARQMGLPVGRLICASNENDVLTDFFDSGQYSLDRSFSKTIAPSMDILISSNLERLLYHACGGNQALVKSYMMALKTTGEYRVDSQLMNELDIFQAFRTSQVETLQIIDEVYRREAYLLDPHSAIAYHAYQQYKAATADQTKTVILATASPFKFSETMAKALSLSLKGNTLAETLASFSALTDCALPRPLRQSLQEQSDRPKVVAPSAIDEQVISFIDQKGRGDA